MGLYLERLDAEGNVISIKKVGDPFFMCGHIRIEGIKHDTIFPQFSEMSRKMLQSLYGDDFMLANLESEPVKQVIDTLKKVAPVIVNGYFAGPDSLCNHPLASPVRGNFFDGFWEDPRIALRATSQPSIFDDTIRRTTETFEGILTGNLFLLHYPGATLAPSQSSVSVGEYVAQNLLSNLDSPQKVLEIGTGGGVITLSMMRTADTKVDFTATDIDGEVLSVAELNAIIGGFDFSRLSLVKSDLFTSIHPNAKFDVIVSNPPFYDTKGALEVIHNPRFSGKVPLKAIDGGQSGLEFYEKILRQGQAHIESGGKFVFQVSPKISQDVLLLGREVLGSTCRDAYCVSDGKKGAPKGIMVIFECF